MVFETNGSVVLSCHRYEVTTFSSPFGRPHLLLINKKKGTRNILDFVDHRVKIKESEKKDKYLDLARGLKKM